MKKKDFLIYFEYLSVLLFRAIFTLSFVGKLLYPYTFNSYIINFFKYHNISFLLDIIGIDLFLYVILSLTLIVEALLLYSSFTNKKMFYYGTMAFFLMTTLIVLYGYFEGLGGDCGCYGIIFSFDNNLNHLGLNTVFFTISLLLIMLRKKIEFSNEPTVG